MFSVHCSPRTAPQPAVTRHLPCTRRAPRSPAACRLPARSPPRTVCPGLVRPSAERGRLRPAPELGHLPGHGHGLHVLGVFSPLYVFRARCSPLSCPPILQYGPLSAPSPLCTMCAPRSFAPVYFVPTGGGSRVAHHTPYALLTTRQYATSLSAANKLLIRCAWAGNPGPRLLASAAAPLAMTRAGRREAAPKKPSLRCACAPGVHRVLAAARTTEPATCAACTGTLRVTLISDPQKVPGTGVCTGVDTRGRAILDIDRH